MNIDIKTLQMICGELVLSRIFAESRVAELTVKLNEQKQPQPEKKKDD